VRKGFCGCDLKIDTLEVGPAYSHEKEDARNISGTTTEYNVSVRRSTLRFTESYRWPDAKDKGKELKEFSGYCASYESVR
jgi:hypothetical protein